MHLQVLRDSARWFKGKPLPTFLAGLVLALAMGIGTAAFSVMNAVLLRPPPYSDAKQIVAILEFSARRGSNFGVTPARFLDIQNENRSFETIAAFRTSNQTFVLTGIEEPQLLHSAPLVDGRRQYLTHWAVQGMTKSTLEAKARLVLSIAEYLRLADRPSDTISLSEIEKAATRWSNHNWPSPQSSRAKRSREYFLAQAAKWLTFLNRLQTAPEPVTSCDQMLAEFRSFMKEDRGLSPATVKYHCSSVRPFLNQLLEGKRSLEAITVSDVDSLLAQKVNKEYSDLTDTEILEREKRIAGEKARETVMERKRMSKATNFHFRGGML